MEIDADARRAAVALLARGLLTPTEAAALAGVSRQLLHAWMRRARVDWQRIRGARLASAWRKELYRGARLRETEAARAGKPGSNGRAARQS
jgi:transposase-like protein